MPIYSKQLKPILVADDIYAGEKKKDSILLFASFAFMLRGLLFAKDKFFSMNSVTQNSIIPALQGYFATQLITKA